MDAGYEREVRALDGARIRYEQDDVRLLSPLPRPNSIRDFSVFEDRATEHDKPDVWYEIPTYYKGNPDSVVHPDADVEWPEWEDRLDFHLEVAAVIGKPGRNIDAPDASEHIAGYTIFKTSRHGTTSSTRWGCRSDRRRGRTSPTDSART